MNQFQRVDELSLAIQQVHDQLAEVQKHLALVLFPNPSGKGPPVVLTDAENELISGRIDLDMAMEELAELTPSDMNRWRYEDYPWPGAEPEPLW